jgi:hypothetical protein
VELAYTTPQGHLVVVDTLGTRVLYTAYRFDGWHRTWTFLTNVTPLETVAQVDVSVDLHRKGWTGPGETVLRRIRATMFRTRTGHLLAGGAPGSLRMVKKGAVESVLYPYPSVLDPIKKAKGITEPLASSPCLLLFQDASVKAVRRRGRTVEVFGAERAQMTDLVIGKLRAVLEFATEAEATRFAEDFPRIEEPGTVDPTVTVDLDRSRRIVWSLRVLRKTWWAILFIVGYYGGLLYVYLALGGLSPLNLAWLVGWVGVVVYVFLPSHLRAFRKEWLDFADKWPKVAMDRWAADFPKHAQGFAFALKDLGVELDAMTGDLEPLDRYLRSLPPDAFFGPFAWGAAALVGGAFLAAVGRRTDYAWKYSPEHFAPVLHFESIEFLVSPFTWVVKIWQRGWPERLDALVQKWSGQIQRYLAFRFQAEFIALGFFHRGWADMDPFEERLRKDVESAAAVSYALGEDHYRRRSASYGPFRVDYVEVEIESPRGPRFIPLLALPSSTATQILHGTLEGASPRSPTREDVVFVRFEGNELAPLGIELRNYLEVAPRIETFRGRLAFHVSAIADSVQVVTPRMRGLRSETKDFVAPLEGGEGGVPMGPYASVLGRVTSVVEMTNPVTATPVWRVGLDASGFPLEVHVRKDRCDGVPAIGQYLAGSVWLVGDVVPAPEPLSEYIR